MFKNPKRVFILLFLLTIALVIIDLPENYRLKFTLFGRTVDRVINPPTIRLFGWTKQIQTSLGLDLAGGSHVVLEADMKDIKSSD
ncbi:MAG TPA: hypothetical protein VJB96_04025, partial [Patescibacteria group bacterium]|nr:hypothetical protein [Patescibacteria group bacterium]